MNDTNPAALPETGRPLTAREFFSLLPAGAPPYIPEVDDPDDEDTTGLTPEREQEIRELSRGAARMAPRGWMTAAQELLAELDRVRAERDRFAETARGIVADYDTGRWGSTKDQVNELRYVLEGHPRDVADRATILREGANALAALGPLDSLVSAPEAWTEAIETLRRMADEQPATRD